MWRLMCSTWMEFLTVCYSRKWLLLLPPLHGHCSHVRPSVTPRTMARQAPPSMGFSRQEYWSGWPFPSPVIKLVVKSPHASARTQEMQIQSLGQEELLEEETVTHSGILAWRIPWTGEPGYRLQSMGSQRVNHNWAINTSLSHAYVCSFSDYFPL